ncbi:EscU/YscU/HrcU family type III secretion system export apparatus switch protein [Novosphingobium beihaiensis]|uniref:EscU/YscU/HrcU family type III secretion system export apparatus switch protein n=1 Tax=Novosphingobium beihaiensis TaxID=2930389 RepID=A0ABT0BPT1_9SPHN|nr:EscU/YscU/HrcU family type III secretion system export apparatus switch protein [Novosphingobium beihaiensis]MCJ2186975.1 EscU/YscU/HrcU family type III secretion system export apparatus switch protein [Novosphingobium beihaiensis]
MEGQEQDRSEEATPFKLRKAREKGQVARGMDLGFLGSLTAFAAFGLMFGAMFFHRLALVCAKVMSIGIASASSGDGRQTLVLIGQSYHSVIEPLLVLGSIVAVVLILLELLQLRGFIFTAEPLKPDFTRLNPAKGLKRLFSLRMLKEAAKNTVKMAIYTGATAALLITVVKDLGPAVTSAPTLANAMGSAGRELLFLFMALAAFFAVIDQIIVRREFGKQMRMSRRELKRETKDREGEPRQKQKRRKLHSEFIKNAQGMGPLEGTDFLITNPEHFAVALQYQPEENDTPMVRAKGRNQFAQVLKRRAHLLAIPIYPNPPLARVLYSACDRGQPIPVEHFEDVAKLYHHHFGRMAAKRQEKT